MTAPLKSYLPPWKGRLLLACKKCQKKLKPSADLGTLYNLKKALKKRNKQHPENPLHVLNVPCMDVCPKNAVVAILPSEGEKSMRILRSEDEIDQLYQR